MIENFNTSPNGGVDAGYEQGRADMRRECIRAVKIAQEESNKNDDDCNYGFILAIDALETLEKKHG